MLTDPVGDLVDPDGNPTDGPDYLDLDRLTVTMTADELVLHLDLVTAPPRRDPLTEEITYALLLDTNADGSPNYFVLAGNHAPDYAFTPSLFDVEATQNYSDAAYPGSFVEAAGVVRASVRLDAIGRPAAVGAIATSEWLYFPDYQGDPLTFVEVSDPLPDDQWPDGGSWLYVSPPEQ